MRSKRLHSYKNENILYENKSSRMFLEMWLDKEEDYIFEVLKKLGIETSFVVITSLDKEYFLGDTDYTIECLSGDYKLILRGSILSSKENPKTINIIKEQNLGKFLYVDGVLEQQQTSKENIVKKTDNKVVNYENKKTKKYLKEFFNNDSECEIKLFDILNSLGVNKVHSIYLQDLKLVKENPFNVKEFSMSCLCYDENNTVLNLNSKKEKIGYSRKINVSSDMKNIEFDYNVYTEELVHKQKTLEKKLK